MIQIVNQVNYSPVMLGSPNNRALWKFGNGNGNNHNTTTTTTDT